MLLADEKVMAYKWDQRTHSGFKLRFDRKSAQQGLNCFHIEDWNCHAVIQSWVCRNLDEALEVLNARFNLDVSSEKERLLAWSSAA